MKKVLIGFVLAFLIRMLEDLLNLKAYSLIVPIILIIVGFSISRSVSNWKK